MERYLDPDRILSGDKDENFYFFTEFRDLLVLLINTSFSNLPSPVRLDRNGRLKSTAEVFGILKTKELHINHVGFPGDWEGEEIIKILEHFGSIRFTQCQFHLKKIDLRSPRISFFECRFSATHEVLNVRLRKDHSYDDCIYQNCIFDGDLHCGIDDEKERTIIQHPLFSKCTFSKNLKLRNVELEGYLFDPDQRYPTTLHSITATNCIFQSGTYLNIKNLMDAAVFRSCIFKGKFEFKRNRIGALIINNCNFEKVADFHGSLFLRFKINKSIFSTFAGFENCIFGQTPLEEKKATKLARASRIVADFSYVTFLEHSSFRNAVFVTGLNIEKINTIEPPNFHNTQVSFEHTNRETFRIIKHALDAHGSHIEANKYFALEMKKFQKELSTNFWDSLIYKINGLTSDFGQSYLRAISCIIILSITFSLLSLGQEKNILYKIYPPANDIIRFISSLFNGFASGFLPFKQFLRTDMEFISLIFYIIFGILIWQTIIAVKRLIKR